MDNKEFKWDDATVAELLNNFYDELKSKQLSAMNARSIIGQFKQSKQPKRDWQIESFKSGVVGKYYERNQDGTFYTEKSQEEMLKHYPIYSVRRLSDGQIFSVGDENISVAPHSDRVGKITKINLSSVNDGIYFDLDWPLGGYSGAPIGLLSKAPEKPKPLLFEGKVTLEQYIDDPTFPCLFVPEQTGRNSERYLVWDEADLVECKIRGLGSYFKVSISKIDKQQ